MNETPTPRQAAAEPSELSIPDKPMLIPIIVGIVGKREIGEHGPTVERGIFRVLADLRRRYPDTPILVLTSLAQGSDWWGARAAARFASAQKGKQHAAPAVRLVCPLPFERALYEQDFDTDHKDRFARLHDKREIETEHGLVTLDPADLSVFALRPLVGADPMQMDRSGGASGPHRTLHYEQCGMFIADACHLLIAVLPGKETKGEAPERVGGTARILHYKCTGALPGKSGDPSFDSLVAALEAGRGLTAKPSWATHDPATHRLRRLSKELPEPLPPAQWFTRSFGHVWQLVPGANWTYLKGAETKDRQASVDSPKNERPKPAPAHKGDVYALMEPFDAFNRRVKRARRKGHLDARWVREQAFANRIAEPGPAGPISADEHAAVVHLSRLRGTIAELQERAKKWADRSLRMLAALFVATVGVFTHYKIWHDEKWAAHAYLILLLLATGWYAFARYRQWSAIHDDYRAVAEALRAQRGWRLAGIRERAEWHYRAGTTQQLERVRQGIETVNTLIAIENRAAEIAEPIHRIDLARRAWLGEQVRYFTDAHAARKRSNARHTLAIFGFFYLGVGLFLALWHHSLHGPAPDAWPILARIWSYALEAWARVAVAKPLAIAILAVSCVAFVLRFRLALPAFKKDKDPPLLHRWIDAGERWIEARARNRRAVYWLTWPYPVLWGLLPVVAGLWLGNAALGYAETHHEIDRAEPWLGLTVAVLNAIAAAAIYLREKLAIEPEERSYEEMQHVFALADDLLQRTADPEQQRNVLIELGQEALAENAYWLRAHRERPIEQIPG